MKTAKVIRDGEFQAIRLPQEIHIDGDEVFLKPTSTGFMVMTRDPWTLFREGVAEMPEAAFEAERLQPPAETREP